MTEDTTQTWYSETTATLGDRITGAREAAGLAPEDLARNLGVKLKTVLDWENDVSEPRANRLQMMSGLLNVSLRWMLTGEGDGLDGPPQTLTVPPQAVIALSELAALRARAQSLAKDIAETERTLRAALKATA